MLIKFNSEDPNFEQAIKLLKLKYKTGATSKAVKRAVYDFYEMEIETEMLRIHNDLMSQEIERLRQLMDLYRSTKNGTKWRYLK
jgi:hypothetical protein